MIKRFFCTILLSISIGTGLSPAQQQRQANPDSLVAAAKSFVGYLATGDDARCVTLFDSTMTALVPESKVKEMWDGILSKSGAFRGELGSRTQKFGSYDIVFVTCQFERDTLDVRVVFDAAGKIAGLFYAHAQAIVEYQPPTYVDRSAFREEEVMVQSGKWSLPGTLSLPIGGGPFPAVVLVHGSGPNDRDETIGPNKPFRDLAWGLASRGIAVLRYEKRTRAYAVQLSVLIRSLTVKDETIDDAIAAVSLLQGTKGIDPNRVFVLGHSLGGMLVPRIGVLDPVIAGFVVLAGATRPLEDLVLEQTRYILSLHGPLAESEKKQIEEIEEQRGQIKALKEADTALTKTVLGAPASYWLDLRGYDPPAVAHTLTQPMLILQGERDYQVTLKDYERWKSALQTRRNVTFKLYPKLNHLFIEGEGKSSPAEYEKVGHVAEYVISDIANWIKK
jgi:dienelactone hydrolase